MTNLLFWLGGGVLGLSIGSFLNVLILRDKERASILTGRSQCPHCRKILQWWELLPVLSFILLRGRCSRCHKPISWQYPLVEIFSAGLILYSLWQGLYYNSFWLALGLAISLSLFLVSSVIDLKQMELPLEYILLAGVFGALGRISAHQLTWISAGEGLLVGAGVLALVAFIWRFLFKEEGMGEGDIWLAGCLGAMLGYPLILVALFLAVLLGAGVGLGMVGLKGRSLKTALPFGPFLALALLLTLILGQSLLRWYIL